MEEYMKVNSKLIVSFAILFILIFFTDSAFSYLDPGTGSMMVQALIAIFAVVSVSIGIFWRRLRSFLSRIFSQKSSEGNDSDDS